LIEGRKSKTYWMSGFVLPVDRELTASAFRENGPPKFRLQCLQNHVY
jgi:hypothetical protein